MIDFYEDAYREGLKEFCRVFLMAVIPVVVFQIEKGQDLDWRSLLTVGVIAILKALDRTLHEKGKIDGNESMKLGLTRF